MRCKLLLTVPHISGNLCQVYNKFSLPWPVPAYLLKQALWLRAKIWRVCIEENYAHIHDVGKSDTHQAADGGVKIMAHVVIKSWLSQSKALFVKRSCCTYNCFPLYFIARPPHPLPEVQCIAAGGGKCTKKQYCMRPCHFYLTMLASTAVTLNCNHGPEALSLGCTITNNSHAPGPFKVYIDFKGRPGSEERLCLTLKDTYPSFFKMVCLINLEFSNFWGTKLGMNLILSIESPPRALNSTLPVGGCSQQRGTGQSSHPRPYS